MTPLRLLSRNLSKSVAEVGGLVASLGSAEDRRCGGISDERTSSTPGVPIGQPARRGLGSRLRARPRKSAQGSNDYARFCWVRICRGRPASADLGRHSAGLRQHFTPPPPAPPLRRPPPAAGTLLASAGLTWRRAGAGFRRHGRPAETGWPNSFSS